MNIHFRKYFEYLNKIIDMFFQKKNDYIVNVNFIKTMKLM